MYPKEEQNMDLQRLKYFCTIMEEGQISKAATKLHMAQPPLSRQLKSLEEELEVDLFIRNARTLTPTEAGYMLYEKAKTILYFIENTKHDIALVNSGKLGTLSMGCIDSISSYIVCNYIKKYRQENPNVRYNFYTGNSKEIITTLQEQIIEFGILRPPFDCNEFNSSLILKENMIAIVPKSICSKEGILDIEELSQYPILLHKRYRNIVEDYFIKNHHKLDDICLVNDTTVLHEWARQGLGVAIVPKSSCLILDTTNLVYRDIGNGGISCEAYIIWLKNRYLSVVARKFLNLFHMKEDI